MSKGDLSKASQDASERLVAGALAVSEAGQAGMAAAMARLEAYVSLEAANGAWRASLSGHGRLQRYSEAMTEVVNAAAEAADLQMSAAAMRVEGIAMMQAAMGQAKAISEVEDRARS